MTSAPVPPLSCNLMVQFGSFDAPQAILTRHVLPAQGSFSSILSTSPGLNHSPNANPAPNLNLVPVQGLFLSAPLIGLNPDLLWAERLFLRPATYIVAAFYPW